MFLSACVQILLHIYLMTSLLLASSLWIWGFKSNVDLLFVSILWAACGERYRPRILINMLGDVWVYIYIYLPRKRNSSSNWHGKERKKEKTGMERSCSIKKQFFISDGWIHLHKLCILNFGNQKSRWTMLGTVQC